jgi:hypothetical protein
MAIARGQIHDGSEGAVARKRAIKKVSCEDCFFRRNLLCALELDEACATFRPDSPEGLKPPEQLRFAFRQEQRGRVTWAFPSAQEQATRYEVLTG